MKAFFLLMLVAAIGCGLYYCLLRTGGMRTAVEVQEIQHVWGTEVVKGGYYSFPRESELSQYPTNSWPLVYGHVLSVARSMRRDYDDVRLLALIVTALLFVTSIGGLVAAGKTGKGSNQSVERTRD
jgi:hypothetical protein